MISPRSALSRARIAAKSEASASPRARDRDPRRSPPPRPPRPRPGPAAPPAAAPARAVRLVLPVGGRRRALPHLRHAEGRHLALHAGPVRVLRLRRHGQAARPTASAAAASTFPGHRRPPVRPAESGAYAGGGRKATRCRPHHVCRGRSAVLTKRGPSASVSPGRLYSTADGRSRLSPDKVAAGSGGKRLANLWIGR